MLSATDCTAAAGSSPRMRGTPVPHSVRLCNRRIIPAHAGNTTVSRHRTSASKDHPRACGEHVDGASHDVGAEGSSPRMRGTLHPRPARQDRRRIIPAHAGNTTGTRSNLTLHGDHPRACGEHGVLGLRCIGHGGSSPRMRGTPQGAHRR